MLFKGGVIEWTNHQQNLVLGAFYPGYFMGHLPAGILSDVYGGRYVFAIGMMISTALTLITPIVVVNTPYYITIVLRNMMGLGQVRFLFYCFQLINFYLAAFF